MADQRIVLQCHNWMGIPHQTLYDDIHGGSGTAALEAAQDAYAQTQVSYAAIFAALQGGLTLAGAHEGAAADASQAGISVFGNWVDEAMAVAGDDHSGVNTFSTSYALAKNDMPLPVQVNAVDSAWDDVKDFFGGTTAREAQEQAAHDAHAKAAQVMTTFFDSGAGAANQMPYWTAPQQVAFEVPVPPPSGSGGVAEGGGAASSIAGGGAGNGSGGGVDAGAGRAGPVSEVTRPVSTAPVVAAPGQPGGGAPGASVAPAATVPAGGAGATVVPPGGLAPGAAGRGGVPGAGPGGAGGIGAGRAGGVRGVGGVGGAAGGAASGSGGAVRSASGAATSNAGTAPRGVAGAAGRPGMGMGMAPMGGAGGRGSDDTEHQRKFPLEDNLFADERRVAPPVIGADPED